MTSSGNAYERVTIITPVRDCPDDVRTMLRSVKEHAPGAELIVVDNCSRDNTAEVAKSGGALVLSSSGTPADCRRFAAAHATADLLLLLDSDQTLVEDTVCSAVRTLLDEDADAVVIPERSSLDKTLFSRTLDAERHWSEISGVGLPRLFRKRVFLAQGDGAAGVRFGEDLLLRSRLERVAISEVPVLHRDPESLAKLLHKYRAYGASPDPSHVATGSRGRALLHGLTKVPVKSMPMISLAVGVKAGKAAAYLVGSIFG